MLNMKIKYGDLLGGPSERYNVIYMAAILSLCCYVFLCDFAYAIFNMSFLKPISALSTLIFAGFFFVLDWKRIKFKEFLLVSFFLTILYTVVLHNQSSSYLYTPIFGVLMVQRPKISLKLIDIIFFIQLLLLLFEYITRHHLYTQVTTGLFTIKELDLDSYYESLVDETGFRAKGLFFGVLVATSFAINYSLIYRNNYKKSFLGLLMALLIGGRLAILICGSIFLYNFYIKKNHYKTKFNVTYIVIFFSIVSLGVFLIATFSNSIAVQHMLNVFNMEDTSNAGRIARYGLGLAALLNYSPSELLFGSTYELFDQWNRPVPTESDILGMLLEIGIIGLSLVFYGVVRCWRSSRDKLFMPNFISHKYVILMSVMAMIQYRHLSGNVRGLMFWFVLLLILDINKKGILYGKRGN